MGENVQCPVCTLFLHAGMNLSDHLETHPKEQVIKALVQMTISGSGGSAASSALAASLSGGSAPKTDPDEKLISATVPSDSDATSDSATSGTSNFAVSDTTKISSQSFANAFCGISAVNKPSTSTTSATTTSATLRVTVDAAVNANNKNTDDKREIKSDAGSASDKVQGSVAMAASASGIGQVQLPGQFDDYAANRYHQMQQKQLTTSQLEQRHQQQQHQKNQLHKQKSHMDSASTHIDIAPQRNILPPPPPPIASMPLVVGQVPNKLLHQSHANNLFASNVAAHRPIQMHPIHQTHQQLQHQYQQQQQAHNQQQQQQQQQNLKIYYSTALPTSQPTLQLFPFHASTQLQHQKPPPAYGTAISQIRSQNNQNKGKHAADKNHIQQQQQQQPHQQLARQVQQRATLHPTQTQTSSNCTPSLQLHQHQLEHALANIPTVSAKPTIGAKATELLPPPPPPTRTTPTNLQQMHQQQLPHSLPHFGAPSKAMPAVQQRVTADCLDVSAAATSQTLAPPTTGPASATTTTPAIVGMSSSPGMRQMSSPYNSLLMSAAQSPSSSSVLRYAESPVAHYLERDNGDFIVQETPKHIVECVEKDNGEFSVIERIYQSPLSVLHIHEDNEKEDDDADDDSSDIKDSKKVSTADDTAKANEVVPMDIECEESELDEQIRKASKSQVTMDVQVKEAEISSNKSTASVDGKVQTKLYGSDKAEIPSTSTSCSNNNVQTNCDRSTTPQHCATTSSAQVDVSSEPSTASNSSANINSDSSLLPSCSTTNCNPSHNSAGTSRKRSSKNTITVLSDVQLNLDEYLDLVGNIIASSKITAKSNTLPGTMPIPLLKVEKEEPPDDEYELPTPQQEQQKFTERKQEYFEPQKPLNTYQASTVIEPPTIANEHETEQIVENNCSSNKVRLNASSDNVKTADMAGMPSASAIGPPTCASHVTSVIRMATTIQQQQTQKDLVPQPTVAADATETQTQHMSDDAAAATAAQTQVTSIIIQDLSRQHIIQLQDEQHAHRSQQQPPPNGMEHMHGLSQQQPVDPHAKAEVQSSLHTRAPTSTTLPAQKRGPKKLIIKPKATKTDANANLSNNINSNPNPSRSTDFKAISSQIIIEEALCEQPTTSTKAQIEMQEKIRQAQLDREQPTPTHHTIAQKLIKSEPSSSAYDSNTNRSNTNGNTLVHSILQNHLTSSADNNCAPIIQCKTEQVGSVQEAQTNFLQPFKEEVKDVSNSNDNAAATDDARVLLDFANSKKHEAPHNIATNFLSVTSIFSNTASKANEPKHQSATIHPNTNTSSTESHARSLRCEDEFIAHDDVQEVVISSSYSQSQSASDVPTSATNSSTTTSHVRDLNVALQQQQQQQQHHQQLQQQQQQQHLQHNFTEYPFSFLYGHGAGVSGTASGLPAADSKGGNFSAIYQQAAQDATTAATLASGSNTIHTDDSTSSTQQQQTHTSHFGGGEVGNAASHWYHHALATANADFEAALAVDCNAAVDGGDVGKYLDLDTCKREVSVGMPGAPSSTSSSFAAATESSLAGGCTADALNIRTDEKMPAKGEISGQESNCDIENSWSQPMYGEISARFFKTTFPGIFQHENGWNHDEYFTVQDLSASAAATGTAPSNRSGKSFDFRLPLEATTSAAANATGSGNSNFQLFARHTDALPSTSASNKKKRKRDAHGSASTATGRVEKASVARVQPTATITSQQLLFPQPQSSQQLQAHEQLQQLSHHAESATSSTSAAAATNGTPSLGADQRRQRKKVYQCTHCTAEFPKLKDRNSHMILQHNYVRQNRRLICVQRADAAAASAAPEVIPSSSSAAAGGVDNVVVVNMAEGCSSSLVRSDSMEFLEDSKQDIVKIEVDNAYQPLAVAPPAVAPSAASTSTAGNSEGIDAKPELVDDKQSMALLPAGSASVNDGVGDMASDALDTKPLIQPLALTTPATKLAALYRMLVSYNISTLKDSHNLSEMEQKLIEQSIFFCYVCRRNFTSVKLYDAHLSEHPAECFTCGKTFQRWKNFSLHLKRHLGWKEFGCNVCDKKFVVRSALVEHMRMHTGHTPLKCKVCGKYFKRYSNLTQHRKRHGKQIIRKKEYVCHCGEVLPSKARFLWHKETHDAKPKCCPYCCDRFVHANSLRRHIRLAHSDKFDYAEPMECPLCKQTFAKSSIKAHMATHSMDTQHDCAICNKSFSTKWNLKIHSWVHANRTSKPFKCEHCPKAFVREVDFKNHMNAHKQIKPYTCEYCGCKFIRKYNYMRHRREHHGNKKFTCDLCKKSFHRHYYLIEHRRIHTGERPFQCTICGKSSTTKTNHNKHLKIHHSRDPFTVEA